MSLVENYRRGSIAVPNQKAQMPSRATERINFGKIKEVVVPPNMIELQTNSYKEFLQADASPKKRRKHIGLEAVFLEVFPIESYDGTCVLDYDSYEICEPKVAWLEGPREGRHARLSNLILSSHGPHFQ